MVFCADKVARAICKKYQTYLLPLSIFHVLYRKENLLHMLPVVLSWLTDIHFLISFFIHIAPYFVSIFQARVHDSTTRHVG